MRSDLAADFLFCSARLGTSFVRADWKEVGLCDFKKSFHKIAAHVEPEGSAER